MVGIPCDINGSYLPPNSTPPDLSSSTLNKWALYENQLQFELADFFYCCNQMPQKQFDELMDLWAVNVQMLHPDAKPPFANHQHLFNIIDSTSKGEAPWKSFTISYTGPVPKDDPPSWMAQKFEV